MGVTLIRNNFINKI